MLFTITNAGGSLPVGVHKAKFVGIEKTTTAKGDALRWRFETDDGNEVGYFSDTKPTTKNKVGRWLAALSGKTLTDGVAVNDSEYIGRRYMLIIEANDKGGTSLNTFTAI